MNVYRSAVITGCRNPTDAAVTVGVLGYRVEYGLLVPKLGFTTVCQ